jgi:hypothetical protein
MNLAFGPASYGIVNDSSTLKMHPEDRIVLTIALGIALTILQPQRRVNSYNFGAELDFDYTTGSKHHKRLNCRDKTFPPPKD